jgi:hypothetical protein
LVVQDALDLPVCFVVRSVAPRAILSFPVPDVRFFSPCGQGIEESVTNFRGIAVGIKRSSLKQEIVKVVDESLKTVSTRAFVLDVCTRWNSTYMMLDRILERRVTVEHLFSVSEFKAAEEEIAGERKSEAKPIKEPREAEWRLMEHIVEVRAFLRSLDCLSYMLGALLCCLCSC